MLRFSSVGNRPVGMVYNISGWTPAALIKQTILSSEAITSMFRWYSDSVKCYVYLSDVPVRTKDNNQAKQPWESAFRKSKVVYKRLDASRTNCSKISRVFFVGRNLLRQ